MNQNICPVKWIKVQKNSQIYLIFLKEKKIQFSVEIIPWELKKRQFVMLITDVTIQILVSNLLGTKLYYND